MKAEPIDPNDLDLADDEISIDPNASAFEITRMPWGKYKGWRISELPDRYLFWIATNLDLDGLLREAIDTEVERRRQPTTPSLSCEVRAEAGPPATGEGVTATQRAEARYAADNRDAARIILQEPEKHGPLLTQWARAVLADDKERTI